MDTSLLNSVCKLIPAVKMPVMYPNISLNGIITHIFLPFCKYNSLQIDGFHLREKCQNVSISLCFPTC